MTKKKPKQVLSIPIYNWIKNKISTGHYKEGDKIPSEAQLRQQFNVSSSVVREALSQLKNEGLVTSHQGKGVFVNPRGNRSAFRLEFDELPTDTKNLSHVIELLMAIESAAAKYAAIRRTESDLKNIRRALIAMEYAIACDKLGDKEDFNFHQAIVDATHNQHFIALNDYLEKQVRQLIRSARSNTAQYHQNLIQFVQQEHKAIFDAIEKQDPEAAEKAAEIHLRNAATRLDTYINYASQSSDNTP